MAIAFDAKTLAAGTSAGSTSTTFAHTVSGTDRFLLLSLRTANWNAGNPTSVSGTYNGVSATVLHQNIQVFNINNWRFHGLYLIAPATGTNNVVLSTTGGSGVLQGLAVSYTGVDQTSPILASNTASAPTTGNTMTISLTTADVGWWFIAGANVDVNWTGGANTTNAREPNGGNGCADSGGNISAQTGNAQISHGGTRGYGGFAVAFKESSSVIEQALTATAQATASYVREVGLIKSVTANINATIETAKTILHTLTATAQATATVAKRFAKTLVTTARATASIVNAQVSLITLTATAQAITSIASQSINTVTLTVTASASATIQKISSLLRTLTATASATTSLVQSGLIISRELLVTARATVTQTFGLTLSKVLTVTASSVVSLARDFGFLDKYPENEATYEDKYPES